MTLREEKYEQPFIHKNLTYTYNVCGVCLSRRITWSLASSSWTSFGVLKRLTTISTCVYTSKISCLSWWILLILSAFSLKVWFLVICRTSVSKCCIKSSRKSVSTVLKSWIIHGLIFAKHRIKNVYTLLWQHSLEKFNIVVNDIIQPLFLAHKHHQLNQTS